MLKMNKFKVSSNSAFQRLYDPILLNKYSSDDNLMKIDSSGEMGYYLFCYGSNSTNQLKKRLNKKNIESQKAYLPNYTRIFAGHSAKWNGGVASIISTNDNHCVKGSLIFLKESELKKLDKYEGANKNENPFSKIDNIYRRTYVNVKDKNNDNITSIVYIKNNNTWKSYPSEEYLAAVKNHLKEYWDELDVDNQLNVYNNDLILKGIY